MTVPTRIGVRLRVDVWEVFYTSEFRNTDPFRQIREAVDSVLWHHESLLASRYYFPTFYETEETFSDPEPEGSRRIISVGSMRLIDVAQYRERMGINEDTLSSCLKMFGTFCGTAALKEARKSTSVDTRFFDLEARRWKIIR